MRHTGTPGGGGKKWKCVNAWDRTDLCGEWKLYYQRNEAWTEQKEHPTTWKQVASEPGVIPARVPGNFEIDLERAGRLEDPFFGQNILKTQALESTHMVYARTFEYHRREGYTPVLVFEGLDTVAEVYVNGTLAGKSDNMLVERRIELADLADGENDIAVHILPACVAARGGKVSAANNALKYNYETMRLRKSASMFGWDIMPRMVSGGIYRPVYIEDRPKEYIKQCYLMTTGVDAEEKTADLALFFEVHAEGDDLSRYAVSVKGKRGESGFEASDRLWFTAGKIFCRAEGAKLWWPRGYGDQPLYDVEVTLTRDGEAVDRQTFRTGLRTVALERTALTDMFFNGKFRFTVNGKPIFVLGTNFVPIDALHSRDRERLPRVMDMALDVGVNAIRCWGGGVYEDDYFYDFCDEKGILVWQDFMMACGTYPADDDFCRVMEAEGEAVVRRLRQHPCLLLWSGDNECDMSAFRKHPSGNRITREVLPRVVEYEDPTRPYLPSSPFVDKEAEGKDERYLPEYHLWGPRDYFKSDFYRNSLCSFASEIGYHGCPSRVSLEKFLPKEALWPWQGNDDWMVHAASMEKGLGGSYSYRISLMARQIRELFGDIPENLDDFALASQISQAEAMKFFVEMFRMDQPRRTGIIWWNLIDGWPQFSDAVADYYCEKKLAYYFLKRAQEPFILCMREPDNWKIELMAVNDTGIETEVKYTLRNALTGEIAAEGARRVAPGAHGICQIPYSQGEKKIYRMDWEQNGRPGSSHYLCGRPPFDLAWYRSFLDTVFEYGKGGVWREL